MERRTKLGLLILLALLILAFGIWYLLQPFFKTVEQPPQLPGQVTPGTNLPATSTIPLGGSSAGVAPDVKRLQDLAGIFVSRLGSGASGEGLRGYNDVLINATVSYRETLLSEQNAMIAAHPSAGPHFGVLTRVVATDIVSAAAGASEMTFRVQVQQAEDAGDPSKPTRILYKEATVTFQRQADNTYLVSNVVWKDIER